ncbi:hypothetical protein TNIN_126561 [Trichonephila inaurata madagascariensis]|uniref:Uncharacterized protein n=1 Tax=Trichonephila inaurata madagascariensis TaxID=2747483 RepID=A0A8X6XQK4_9ARAC|nr:hypothetical protein TNIN_126561 [Trichonephila inaurata madagascariensis]
MRGILYSQGEGYLLQNRSYPETQIAAAPKLSASYILTLNIYYQFQEINQAVESPKTANKMQADSRKGFNKRWKETYVTTNLVLI